MEPPTLPRSRKEADAQLKKLIRKRRALRGQKDKFTGEQLGGALKLLSEHLYSNPTHFILELIQNADDNDYSAAINQNLLPSFSLSLKSLVDADGQKFYDLETGCNENGFSIDQIDALCCIGKSTKKSKKDVHSGYVGEKGIGFKSVFKVASVVHISSGFYHFKLNKTGDMLGVMLPLPSRVIKQKYDTETTRMTLRIGDRQYHGKIAKDLRKMKSEVLLFLRRLRHIIVQVGTEEVEYQATYRSHDEELQGEVRSVVIRKSSTESKKETKYIIVRRAVGEMPSESQRNNIHQSEVTLAFPVKDDGSPIAHEQQTFTFLPIGNYGFRFLIQSDFVLLADRERLPEGNAWNNKLLEAVINAFGDAVERFNKIGNPIQYSWPQYLERTPSRDVFWDSLDAKLINCLKSSRILRSRLGCFQVPETLIFIPPDFCINNAPLIDCPKQRAGHLAAEYTPQNSLPLGLARLGVTTMNEERFISNFCDWVSREKPDLSSKSTEWHGKISAILVAAGQCKARLRNLPLLPTTNGSFVAASTANLYLASREVAWSAPRGLELVLVDPEARDDHRRETLFQRLGVDELWKRNICEWIVRDHRTKHKRDDRRSLDYLVEEMVYLFLHRHLLVGLSDARDLKSIWVQADDDLSPTRARYVY
ncbi:hypothetical protein CFIO01_06881 [Colletotrichum fioriniae PJ7]|uniref:Uncharacterized protein n=1 Tax=Colletotrichum fioriniae PJ7 TaxID=1445577 RepID=A0A010RA43_9PEZI|nr:hypothetical protein CFIO01_06881 [Colletotrichum fioriniae PJ7]